MARLARFALVCRTTSYPFFLWRLRACEALLDAYAHRVFEDHDENR
jgi:hypothetical protein